VKSVSQNATGLIQRVSAATTSSHNWDVAPDGQRSLTNSYGKSAAASITVALYWQAELKK
jgi:hypothetical protein